GSAEGSVRGRGRPPCESARTDSGRARVARRTGRVSPPGHPRGDGTKGTTVSGLSQRRLQIQSPGSRPGHRVISPFAAASTGHLEGVARRDRHGYPTERRSFFLDEMRPAWLSLVPPWSHSREPERMPERRSTSHSRTRPPPGDDERQTRPDEKER